jgi:hypothetical protein
MVTQPEEGVTVGVGGLWVGVRVRVLVALEVGMDVGCGPAPGLSNKGR